MRKDRDTLVMEGQEAYERSQSSLHQKGPWLYRCIVKSSNRKSKRVEDTFANIPHLIGSMIVDHARENETISIYGISRVMKSQLRSYREDI